MVQRSPQQLRDVRGDPFLERDGRGIELLKLFGELFEADAEVDTVVPSSRCTDEATRVETPVLALDVIQTCDCAKAWNIDVAPFREVLLHERRRSRASLNWLAPVQPGDVREELDLLG